VSRSTAHARSGGDQDRHLDAITAAVSGVRKPVPGGERTRGSSPIFAGNLRGCDDRLAVAVGHERGLRPILGAAVSGAFKPVPGAGPAEDSS
jgi:hypothetical protein